MKPLNVVVSLALLCAPSVARAEEWSRFRGPNGTGVSSARGLPAELEPANAVWKTPLPPGHSSPVLTADRIFLTAHDGESLQVIGLDRKTGAVVWKREV